MSVEINDPSNIIETENNDLGNISDGAKIAQLNDNELVISGGFNNLQRFSVIKDKNIKEFTMLFPRRDHGVVPILGQNKIFLISGFSNNIQPVCYQNQNEIFDLKTNQFYKIADINIPIGSFGCANLLDQYIFTFGGMHKSQQLNVIQKYYIDKDVWKMFQIQLPSGSCTQAVSFQTPNRILIFNSRSGNYLHRTYIFNGKNLQEHGDQYTGKAGNYVPVCNKGKAFLIDSSNKLYQYNIHKGDWDSKKF